MNTKPMKRVGAVACLAIAATIAANTSVSAADAISGFITIAAADPNDFVVGLDKNGKCGSPYFHIQRSSINFKENVAMFLTAFAANKAVFVFVTGCAGDRNIISHGYAMR